MSEFIFLLIPLFRSEKNLKPKWNEETFAQFIIQLNKQKEAKVDEKGPNQMIVLAQTPLSRDGD